MSDAVQQGFAFSAAASRSGLGSSLITASSGPAAPRETAPRSGADPSVATGPQVPRFALSQLDAVQWLKSLPEQSVDLVITDPPYESLEKHRAVGTTTRLKHSKASSNDWFQIFPNARFGELFEQVYRVLRPNTHFYLFCDAETMFVAQPAAIAAGFRFWKPLVWDKRKIGMGYHYRARYEFILFFEKGKRRLNDLAQPDVLECARIRGGYPTEKPAVVSSVLVRQSSQQGQLVVDPFMGSGSVGEAALGLGRHFLGNDISPNALDWSAKRLPAWGQSGDPMAQGRPRLL
jgi:site-specific DNA-methyltransferase (adenine-specific)